MFSPAKDQRLRSIRTKNRTQELRFLLLLYLIHALGNNLDGRVTRRNVDFDRLMANCFCQLAYVVRESGREHEVLSFLGQQRQNLANITDKAHVEHAVGFVENKNIDFVEMHRPLLMKIEQATRRCHQNIEAFAQHRFLRIDIHAAEHDARSQILIRAVGFDAVLNLCGELAGRR